MNTSIALRSYSAETVLHRHSHAQLVLPLRGCLELQIGAVTGLVDQSRAAVIHPGQDHQFSSATDNLFVVIDLPDHESDRCEKLPAFINTDAALQQYIQFVYQQLSVSAFNPVIGYSMMSLLMQLLEQRSPYMSQWDRRVDAAIRYIHNNLNHLLTVRQLAEVAHLSQRQLHHLFVLHLQLSPSQYIQQLRMQRAAHLLSDPSLSVQQVADQCGYHNLAAFSDRFSQSYGQSPRNFRKSLKQQS